MSQSKNTGHVFGSIDIMHFADLNDTRITGLASPIQPKDAANKAYVDSNIIASNLTGGVGITVNTVNNTINANPSQTQVIALGNVQTGTWTANTIQIPYGGTGQTNFTVNKLIFHNSANKLASVSEFTYDSSTIDSSIPFICSNTTDTTSTLSSIGSLIVQGGVNIKKRLYVNGDTVFSSNITMSNITVDGTIDLNQVASDTSVFTTTSIGTLRTQNMTSTLITSSNILGTNNTYTNLVLSRGTLGNSNFTGLTSGALNVTGVSIFSTTISTNTSSGNISAFLTTSLNISNTNLSTTNLRVSTNVSANNVFITNQTSPNMNITTLLNSSAINTISLVNTHGNITNITNTNLISTNATINNLLNTNLSSSNLISTNIQGTNVTINNLSNTNISSAFLIGTNTSIGTLRVSGTSTLLNLNVTNTTSTNLIISNLTSNLASLTSTTIGTLHATGLSVISTMNASSLSTGTLYSNFSQNNTSSIGTLIVGDVQSTNISTSTIRASSFVNAASVISTNLNTVSLSVSGVSIQSTTLATNISAGIISTPLFVNTNSTITNMVNTNLTVTNMRITLSSVGNHNAVNSSLANTIIVNSAITTNTTATLLTTRILNVQSSYQGGVISSAGSFFNILPGSFVNNTTLASGFANAWYSSYIAAATLSATNTGVTTNKVANLYIRSNVTLGGNQSTNFNSALLLGYATNATGGKLNTQLAFERADGNPYAGFYTESSTNRLVMINSSLAGGSGIGIYTIVDTPVVYSNIPSSTNITPTPYIQLLNSTSTFYSTKESTGLTTGALVVGGGLGVGKTINSSSMVTGVSTTGSLHVDGNVTIMGGALTQTGYGLFSLNTTSYPPGENDIEFNTTANLSSGVSVTVHPFTIGASIVLENVVTFEHEGVYSIHLRLNSSTTTTVPTLLQTNLNRYDGNQWQVYQTSSQNTTFDAYTDFHSHFMAKVQSNEHWKFTFDNGHTANFDFDSDPKKTRLMIFKIG